tara:strand:- start:19930 stop:20445 length:516 start_codon:yes stop_codon:yes gene_type:complete
MAQNSQQTIPTDKFLMIAVNLLHRQFVAATRTRAKQVYREIEKGQTQGMTTVKMEDESTVHFSVGLDHSEFQGPLNFGAFKASVSTLLGNLAKALQEKKDVTVFSVEGNANSVLFGITGVTLEDNRANVMVLGSDVGEEAGAVTLRLMYLSPDQFTRQEGDQVADAAGTSA